MMTMNKTTESEMQKLREEFFDGPASDTMSFDEFLLRKGIKPEKKKFGTGGSTFPDLTGDGKVTKADILKGRGVEGFKNGGCVMTKTNQKVFMG